jgi:hypothetical protein
MTQSVNREFFGLDRFGLFSPPYAGLETIRNQTLPRAITDWRVSPQGGGGFQREAQHYQASETDRLSRIALENPMVSEVLVLGRIANPTKKPKALNSASVALRAGTQGLCPDRVLWRRSRDSANVGFKAL